MPPKVKHSSPDSPADIQNAGNPDELLGEQPCKPDITQREDYCDGEDEDEENYGVCVKGEGVASVVDSGALKGAG